jgi:hypothetical protein
MMGVARAETAKVRRVRKAAFILAEWLVLTEDQKGVEAC